MTNRGKWGDLFIVCDIASFFFFCMGNVPYVPKKRKLSKVHALFTKFSILLTFARMFFQVTSSNTVQF